MTIGFLVVSYGEVAITESLNSYCAPGGVRGYPWTTMGSYLSLGIAVFVIGLITTVIGARARTVVTAATTPDS